MKIARRSLICTAVLALLMAQGCSLYQHAFHADDSWYRPPAEHQYDRPQLPREKIHIVLDAQNRAAENLLTSTAFVHISPEQAAILTGTTPASPNLYLVRAVCFHKSTRGFSVSLRSDNSILVRHIALGYLPAAMKRQPLVLELETPPTEVFVTCSRAG